MTTTRRWRAILGRLDLVERSLVELDAVIAAKYVPRQHEIDLLQTVPGVREKSPRSSSRRPARTCHGSPAPRTWRRGPVLLRGIYESAGKRTPTIGEEADRIASYFDGHAVEESTEQP